MADVLPVNFPLPQESAVASYNWNDILDGTGYVTFYGFGSEYFNGSAGETKWGLISKPVYSDSTHKSLPLSTTAANPIDDITIDSSEFNSPRILRGKLIVNFCVGVDRTPAISSNYRPTIKIYHYDGTTETQIGDTWTGEQLATAGGGDPQERSYVAIIDCPRTNFKIGDILRVKIGGAVGLTSGADLSLLEFGFDPQGRDLSQIGAGVDSDTFTQCYFYVPFEVQL